MGRLVDIDSLRGCAIIRPTSHEAIECIKQCMNDAISHDDIPTAYDAEKAEKEKKALQNRCRALSNGTICCSCPMECENRTMPFLGK